MGLAEVVTKHFLYENVVGDINLVNGQTTLVFHRFLRVGATRFFLTVFLVLKKTGF